LSQNEFQMAMTRDNAWRGLAPVWVAATLWIVVIFHLKGAVFWGYLLMGDLDRFAGGRALEKTPGYPEAISAAPARA